MLYSFPSTSDTRRPPDAAVARAAPVRLLPAIAATSLALTNCVAPPFASSAYRNSSPATSILSPCMSGVGSAPSRTPFTRTCAVSSARLMVGVAPPSMTASTGMAE